MAKKKKKTFQKGQLLSLFENGNYKKVISKIKQFEIEGIDANELHLIQVDSYKKMAQSNFEVGDINRAMRDIESLLTIENSYENRVTKLKYLCYMEHFTEALSFAEDLIESKNLKIKKEAIFLYLLANIYSGNFNLNEKHLKLLPIARKNYVLAFQAFMQDDLEKALRFFDACKPRAKIEKENLEALKSVLLKKEYVNREYIKPLYNFLIHGNDENLQNTKKSREIKKEVLVELSKTKKSREIEHLLLLKSSIPNDTIVKEIKDKKQQVKLIYNNIVLAFEKEKNITKALEIFLKYRNILVEFVESGFLFIQIKSLVEDRKSDKIIVSFFNRYLKLHHKKLSEFQLNFIFIYLLNKEEEDSSNPVKLIEEYGGEDILFLSSGITLMEEVTKEHQESFNRIITKYSFLKNELLFALSNFINFVDAGMDELGIEYQEKSKEHMLLILTLFENSQKPHNKYQTRIFEIFSSLSKFALNFEFSKHKDFYIKLSDIVNKFVDMYKFDTSNFSTEIKELFISIKNKKTAKKETKREDKNLFDMFRDMIEDYEYEYEDFDEDDLKKIKEAFIEALRVGKDPFDGNYKLINLEENFYNDTLLEFALEVTSKAIEFKGYDKYFIYTLLDEMGILPFNSEFRNDLIIALQKYAKQDIKTVLIFLNDCIISTPSKDRETVWYLKWAETYVYLVDDYNQPKDKKFKACLHHFIKVQQKKRFKTLNAKFNKLIERFEDKGLF